MTPDCLLAAFFAFDVGIVTVAIDIGAMLWVPGGCRSVPGVKLGGA